MGIKRIWKLLVRRKVLEEPLNSASHGKPYESLDLFGLGINSVFAFSFYSIIGYLSYYSGPSVIISILIAAIAATLSSLCYAEFGVRIRQDGSSYIYSYVCLGELLAFIVGWTLLLELITSIASLSRDISYVTDVITNGTVYDFFQDICTLNLEYFSSYIDFIALGIPFLLAIFILIPIPSWPKLQKYAALLNITLGLAIMLTIIITQDFGTINWTVDEWFPNGYSGILNSIPMCFCTFMSIEFIIMAKKDSTNHILQKSSFWPIFASLILNVICLGAIVLVTYFVIKQFSVDKSIDPRNVILQIFIVDKLAWAKWFVIACQIFAIFISLYLIMIVLPRILYNMANDSILFKCLGRKTDTYKKPFFGTLVMALISGILGAFFTNEFLLNIIALSVLLIFTFVAVSTLVLRYTDGRIQKVEYLPSEMTSTSISNLIVSEDHVTVGDYFGQLFNTNKVHSPTPVTTLIVQVNTTFYCICVLILSGFLIFGEDSICEGQIWIIIVIAVLIGLLIITLLSISLQPTGERNLSFKVPLIPILPALSILLNTYIMLRLEYKIWIGVGIWAALGLCIYFTCLKIYKRSDNKSTFSLNRKTLNGIMNFVYDEVKYEEALPLPKENTPPVLRTSRAINLRAEEEIQSIKSGIEEQAGKLEQMVEENGQVQSDDIDEEIFNGDDENEYRPNRTSSATYVLDMLDKVLADESDNSGDNVSSSRRKLSFDTESIKSTTDQIEHLALVHREDSTSNVQHLANDQEVTQTSESVIIESNNLETEREECPVDNELEEQEDVVEDISKLYDTIPKTPNVSRVESFMRPSVGPNQKNDMEFALKLNQLLQEQLAEKPHNKGLYKPEIYDDEEIERKLSGASESNSGLLAQINKEILARKKLRTQDISIEKKTEHNDEPEREEPENMKPSDIRNKLELIYKTGPRNPEDVKKTVRKTIAFIPQVDSSQEESANERENANPPEDPNSSSTLAQQLRARKTLMVLTTPKPDSGIDSGNSSTISTDETRQTNEKPESEEEPEIETPADIRMRLNQILSKGPQHPFQLGKKHLPTPTSVPTQGSSTEASAVNGAVESVENKDSPRSSQSSKTLNRNAKSMNNIDDPSMDSITHKKLMGNVFKSIKERKQEPTSRSEGSFLTKLKSQNERIKKNEVIPVPAN